MRAAFPKGNFYVDVCVGFGTLYNDQLFADLYPRKGRPVEVVPWRLALLVVMQYMEGHCQLHEDISRRDSWSGTWRCFEAILGQQWGI